MKSAATVEKNKPVLEHYLHSNRCNMTKVKWAQEYHYELIKVLCKAGYYTSIVEGQKGLTLHEDLHGRGPAITYEGDYEILGQDILIHGYTTTCISSPEMNGEFFAEPENSECVRIFAC